MVNRRGPDGDLLGSELSDSVNTDGTDWHGRDVTVYRVVMTGLALWLAAQVIAGIRLADGLDPLATIGTVLVVALMLSAVGVARSYSLSSWPWPAVGQPWGSTTSA
jgi:hypothetical protein